MEPGRLLQLSQIHRSLFWTRWLQPTPSHHINLRFILKYPPIYIKVFQTISSLKDFQSKFCKHFSSPRSRCMPRPSNPLSFDHPNSIWIRVTNYGDRHHAMLNTKYWSVSESHISYLASIWRVTALIIWWPSGFLAEPGLQLIVHLCLGCKLNYRKHMHCVFCACERLYAVVSNDEEMEQHHW
jgi:hypothetical protein